jgi:hypothetical protein
LTRWHSNDSCGYSGWARFEFGSYNGFYIVDTDQHVLRFEIGVNDATFSVDVIETEQHLLGDLFANVIWDTSMVISLDQAEQVLAENFKDHAHVRAVGSAVSEMVQQ